MGEMITSTGIIGTDFNRSEGRAYLTEADVIEQGVVVDRFYHLREEALERGRRRWVLKAVVKEDVLSELTGSPLEVDISLSIIDEDSSRHLIILGENVHRSDIPEWSEVYNFWRESYGRKIDPISCIDLISEQFRLTTRINPEDAGDLAEIWRPFGWNERGVRELLQTTPNNIWISAVRERSSGRLVSACQGESISLGGQVLVESTEFGTKPRFEGRGLCTAAVVGLNAQILLDTFYKRAQVPLIYSELSMTARSDAIARKSGMTVPLVEGQADLPQPIQILRRNVSILDGHDPNDLNLDELEDQAAYFREAYGDNFRYWRNFIVGILSREAIDRYYSPEQCQEIANYYD